MLLGPYVTLSFMLTCGLYEKSIQNGTNDFVQKSHMVIKHCIPQIFLKKQTMQSRISIIHGGAMFFVCDRDMVPTAKNHFPLPCYTCSELYFTLVILLHGCKNLSP